jgi:hypothetical protein
MSKESTLTTPSDRNPDKKFELNPNLPPLTDEQLKEALPALNSTVFVERFPQVERRYADPAIDLQTIGLVSFVPAKGATPNREGIYGFAKLRGNYPTEAEASARAQYLVKNVDSYHPIYHTYVGRPFPLTTSSEYSKEVDRVELKREIADAIGEDVKKKREKEQQEIEEIKQREKVLLEDVKQAEENKDDHYTTLRVKKAQLVWTYSETEKKMHQMAGLIAKTRREIEELEKTDPNLKNTYYDKYMTARKQAGLSVDKKSADESFMKYLVEDLHLPAVEVEYQKLFGPQ